ncbi:hypothetical protein JXA48_00810 [Candidatus Woesearchaeota archaeon]|nr:hypothetical protein [Candidatus Woesearchaeota archaeon]
MAGEEAATGILSDVNEIGQALGSLFGEEGIKGFFTHLFNAVDGIGVFLIIYGLMMFVSQITLFKAEEHKKYSHMFGIGIALIAITNKKIYSLLVDLMAGTLLTLILILFVVYAIIILLTHLKKVHNEAKEGAFKSATRSTAAAGEFAKVNNETRASRRLMRRERRARGDTSESIDELSSAVGNHMHLIQVMEQQLSHAATLQSKGESTRAVRQGILDRMSSFVASLHHEHKSLKALNVELKNLETLSFREFKLDQIEKNDYSHLISRLQSKAGVVGPIPVTTETKIKDYGFKALQLDKAKVQLLKQMESLVMDANSNESQTDSLQQRLTGALESGNISEASAALGSIKSHLQKIEDDNAKLRADINKVKALIVEIRDFHNAETALVDEIKNP